MPQEGLLNWRWCRRWTAFIRESRIDVIHAHEFDAIVSGWMLARVTGLPFVATVHGKNYYWQRLRRRMAYRAVSRTAQMVAVSEDLKRFMIDKVGMADHQVKVVYNGVPAMASVSEQEAKTVRAELGISESDRVVGAVGSLYPVKGHRYLVAAMADVLQKAPNTWLLLAGRGELEQELKEEAQRLGIAERVRFLGLRQDVPKLLAVMDVFVLPSLSEGLSIALLEAMRAGRPVVATRVGGNPELVIEGKTGFLVAAEDAPALAQAILKLLEDSNQAKTFGARARRLVEQQYTLDRMADEYLQLYQQAMRKRDRNVSGDREEARVSQRERVKP
jgi:glycosyltransferase involved in cell wall biosynthesis